MTKLEIQIRAIWVNFQTLLQHLNRFAHESSLAKITSSVHSEVTVLKSYILVRKKVSFLEYFHRFINAVCLLKSNK